MAEVEVRVGSVPAGSGTIDFSAIIDAEGRIFVHLYVTSFGGPRGHLLRFRVESLDSIDAKLREVRAAAEKLSRLAR